MRADDILAILGPTDPDLLAEIAKTGATEAELREAFAWRNADEALVDDGRVAPSGRVAELVALLEAIDDVDDDPLASPGAGAGDAAWS